MRQEKSKPLVLALKAWFEQQLARVSAKSVIAEAIRYGLNWPCAPGKSSIYVDFR